MMVRYSGLACLMAWIGIPVACAQGAGGVLMNEIQVIGTHNSYHAGFAPSEERLWGQLAPDTLRGLDYRHAPLDQQLEAGVRQIELDVFADAHGGLLADPAGPRLVARAGLSADPPFDPQGLFLRPGFKVLHVQDIDYRSTCQPFVACLEVVRSWSHAHPGHVPVFILVETKSGKLEKVDFSSVEPEAFTPSVFDALDAEIRSVFPPEELITPDLVRGDFATLNKAIRKQGWPRLDAARGKVVFLMDQSTAGPAYLRGHASLRGRVLFTNAEPGRADAAFIERNGGSAAEINALVRRGYLVRTRTDSETREARSGDTRRRDETLASGAQLLSTDYPASEPSRWTGYSVALPGNVAARCNPVLKPSGCTDQALETPARSSTPGL
jgi:hypothetical protein